MREEQVCGVVGVVGGLAVKLLGGFDYSIKAMLLLMFVDIISGFVCAWVFDTSQYSKNGVSSEALFKGAVRKTFMLSIVAIGVVIDKVMGFNYVRNAVVMYFIATEGISILEHMVTMGIPVPKFVVNMLENMRKDETEDEVHETDFDKK